MVPYTFHLRDDAGDARTFEIELFARDVEAVGHARRLLDERPRYAIVEVVEGERRVGDVARHGRSADIPGAAA
jgi:hypothetical protein